MLGVLSKYMKDVSVLRKLLFAVAFLPDDLPDRWDIAVQFAYSSRGVPDISADIAKTLSENIQSLDAQAFSSDDVLQKELLQMPRDKPLGVVLLSSHDTCVMCHSKLLVRKDRPASIVIYDDRMGTVHGTHFHKYCTNRACGCIHYYGYHTSVKASQCSQVIFENGWESLCYFVSSRETAFSLNLLKRFNSEILFGQMSFKQCAEVYNHLQHDDLNASGQHFQGLTERLKVDRRRIEDAFFQYAVLKLCHWYPEVFSSSNLALHHDTVKTLERVTAVYHGEFTAHYTRHRCDKRGCGTVFIMDGNMKNHRDVCQATYAGYTEYDGLPGRVCTGCPNTPDYKSRYCKLHKPLAVVPEADDNKRSTSSGEEDQIGLIIGKRITRNSVLYQVVWLGKPETESSWQPASLLPSKIIDEYENGYCQEIGVDSFASGGQTVSTLSRTAVQSKADSDSISAAKRPKRQVHIESINSGVFEIVAEKSTTDIKCNTEKDKSRINHKTAGAWPCGTIAMLGELFGAESKTQVYGQLHTLIARNVESTSHLEFICYDDGCHLKKYAENSVRSTATPTAEKIALLKIVVDKFHFSGHIDSWCKQHCNPYTFKDLDKVDTEACEQIFSWMSRYSRITQHMSRPHFLFYLLYLCDSRNRFTRAV